MPGDELEKKVKERAEKMGEKLDEIGDELERSAKEKVEEIKEKVDEIKNDLDEFMEKILSKEEREKKLNEFKEKVQKAREELKEKADTLKDSAIEKVQATIDLLSDQINLGLAVLNNTHGEEWEDGEKKGFLKGVGNWFSEKWENFKSKDTKQKVGWTAAGVGLVGGLALLSRRDDVDYSKEIEGYDKMSNREKRKARRKWRKEKRDEEKRGDRIDGYKDMDKDKKEEEKKKWKKDRFWNSGFGKALKWLGVATLIGYSAYVVKRKVDKGKEKKSIEEQMGKLRGFKPSCEKLKSQADNCLKLSKTDGTDYLSNKNEYDKILSDALSKQSEAEKLFIELSKSRASDEIKKESENLKNNIDDYVDEIKAMKDEIYATVPDGNEGGSQAPEGGSQAPEGGSQTSEGSSQTPGGSSQTPGGNGGSGGEGSPEGEGAPEELKPVRADVISQAAIDYIDSEVKAFSLDSSTKNKVKATLNRYFTSYPLLKKGKDGKMVFEIANKAEFGKTIKQLWDDIVPQLGFLARNAAQLLFGNKLNNIDKTMNELDTKAYEDVVFDYFGGVVRHAVQKEGGTMTVQAYYDGISKAYPNQNASQVASHIRGQANKDIKDLRYPLT